MTINIGDLRSSSYGIHIGRLCRLHANDILLLCYTSYVELQCTCWICTFSLHSLYDVYLYMTYFLFTIYLVCLVFYSHYAVNITENAITLSTETARCSTLNTIKAISRAVAKFTYILTNDCKDTHRSFSVSHQFKWHLNCPLILCYKLISVCSFRLICDNDFAFSSHHYITEVIRRFGHSSSTGAAKSSP